MGRTAISVPVDRDFAKQVRVLAKEGQQLSQAYAELTMRILVFAQDFKLLWDRANSLDRGETGSHHDHLREALAKAIQTSNKSIRSRWITIGSHAKTLMPYNDALPPYRDSLYEVARAVEDEKPVTQWIKEKQITIDSSVREVRLLRAGSRSRAKPTKRRKPSNKLRSSYPASITLSFESYSAAADVLSQLLSSTKADFKVTALQSFDAALRERLKDDDYKRAKTHLG